MGDSQLSSKVTIQQSLEAITKWSFEDSGYYGGHRLKKKGLKEKKRRLYRLSRRKINAGFYSAKQPVGKEPSFPPLNQK